MKKLLIALGVSAAMVSGSAMAAELKHEETKEMFVRSSGTVEPSTCDYTPPAGNVLEVTLGKHEQNQLNGTGNTAAVAFDFKFTGCPTTVSKDKSGLKMWVKDGSDLVQDAEKGLLKNAFENEARQAKNVFVQILDSKDNVFKFGENNAVEEDFKKDNQGSITFAFKARLHAPNNDATSGEVVGVAPFVVKYK